MRRTITAAAALLLAGASTAALAQTAAAGDTNDGEIIVTATKRAQALEDVSAAVTAVGQDRLFQARIGNIGDLATIVPTVNFGNDFNQAKIFIRGVGANTSTTGSSTGVALHVDGAYVARAEAQLTSLFDLERVEVLRGPQGTLYGRNAVGGSINLITAKPTDELSGYARLTAGNYSQIVTETAIAGPIADGIRVRLAARTENRDGFGRNPVSGRGVDDSNRRMIRGLVDFDLSSDTSLLLSGEYFRQNDASGAIHYVRASYPGVARLAPLGVGGYAVKPRDLATEAQIGTDTETWAVTGTLRHDFGNGLTLTDIVNYRKFNSSLFQDLDLSAVVNSLQTTGQATTVQERRIDSRQFSNELQLNYSAPWLNAVLGAFYFHERQRPIDNVGLAARNGMVSNIAVLQAAGIDLNEAYGLCGYSPNDVTGGTTVIAPKRVCTRSSLGTRAWAVFGQASINLGELMGLNGVSLKLGGRYSDEQADSANPSIVITRNGLGPVLRNTTAGTFRQRTFRDFTPEAGIEWKATDDVLAYYTYSEGFKAGSGENASGSTTIVDPEKIRNHEVGLKVGLDNRLTVNLAGYHYNLSGLQLNKTIAGGPTGYQTIFQNAARTRATGFELEFFARPTDALRLSGGVSYTDAKFVDYTTIDPLNPRNVATPANPGTDPATAYCAPATCPELNIQLAGNALRNSPRWALQGHAEYELPAPLLKGSLTPMVDVAYRSTTYFTEFNRRIEGADPYALVDLSLNYAHDGGKLTAQLWVRNATDILRRSSTFALATARLIGATYLPPRTFGATVGYRF